MNKLSHPLRGCQIPRPLLLSSIALLIAACAPEQQGGDQVKDINVNVVASADEKYRTQPQNVGGLSAETRAIIDLEVSQYMAERNMVGCAIGITRDDQIAYLQGYGLADKASNRPYTIATPSPIGSISKTLTALGALAMVQDHKLQLDQPLLPQMQLAPNEMPIGWGNPTLREVLAHTGGFSEGAPVWHVPTFSNEASINAWYPGVAFPGLQPRRVFESYRQEPANWSPPMANVPKYSNLGYTVIGALLDRRSLDNDIPAAWRGYERYIWHRVGRGHIASATPTLITAALGTHFRNQDIKNLARGYHPNGNAMDLDGWGWEGPAGGWVMTIGDLSRLMLILQSDAVISTELIANEMRKSYGQYPQGIAAKAGLGLELATDGRWFGKGGGIRGYVADFQVWPRANSANTYTWGFAHVCNQGTSNRSLSGLLREIVVPLEDNVDIDKAPLLPGDSVNPGATFEPLIRRMAEHYLAQAATPEQAWQLAKRDLAQDPVGSRLAALLEAGDVDGALQLLPRWRNAETLSIGAKSIRQMIEERRQQYRNSAPATKH